MCYIILLYSIYFSVLYLIHDTQLTKMKIDSFNIIRQKMHYSEHVQGWCLACVIELNSIDFYKKLDTE